MPCEPDDCSPANRVKYQLPRNKGCIEHLQHSQCRFFLRRNVRFIEYRSIKKELSSSGISAISLENRRQDGIACSSTPNSIHDSVRNNGKC